MSNIEKDINILRDLIQDIEINFEGKIKNKLTNEEIKAISNVLAEREQDKKRIKELEEKNKLLLSSKVGIDLSYDDYIPKQKVKDLLIEIQKEYEKLDKASDEFLRNKEKTVEDYVLEKERLTTMQTLAYCRDNLEELSEDK